MTGRDRSIARRTVVRAAHLRGDAPLVVLDALLIVVAMTIALVLRFDGSVPDHRWSSFWPYLLWSVPALLAVGCVTGLYGQLWRHASVLEARRLMAAGALGLLVLLGGGVALPNLLGAERVPVSVVVLGGGLGVGLQGLVRFQSRLFAYRRRGVEAHLTRVVVVGAGATGASLVADMLEHPEAGLVPVGLLDDDRRTHGRLLHGVRVLGTIDDLPDVVREHSVEQAVVALGDAPQHVAARTSSLADDTGIAVRVLPRRSELSGSGSPGLTDVRDLRIDDLLGRQQVATDLDAVRALLQGKRVLITGAGGSIGSEIARQVAECQPASLLLLDHDETHLHDVAATLANRATQVLCDIRQRDVVHRAFALHRPQVVFHAAAHKHVPLLEDYPSEAVKTNVSGTRNVVDAAATMGVERFVFISTDKAVRPSSVMGATKAVGELLVLEKASAQRQYCAVRFGNVLGSRGSVIPTFIRQIQQGGPVTVTDARMTRFFMSIPEAVQLVLQSAALARGGEVFMLEMGRPMLIMDLAKRLIRLSGRRVGRDVEIRVTGVRPGEKLAEELSTPEEGTAPTSHPSINSLRPVPLDAEVLRHEVDEVVAAADNGFEAVVRSSVFHIAARTARRRRADVSHCQAKRVVDLAQLERTEGSWNHSTT